MNNNKMIQYTENFITKIKKLLKKFYKKQKIHIEESKSIIKPKTHELTNKFYNEITVDTKVFGKQDFLKEIEGNEKALSMLSVDRLKKIENYYDNIIKQNELKIKKLKGLIK